MNNNRGSEWRKWDLHIHTPESGMANGFNSDWDTYARTLFKTAVDNNVAVLGITDYFTIDGYKILKSKYFDDDEKLSALFADAPDYIEKIKQIRLFPNIEFRLKVIINNSRVNYHVIFSDEVQIQDIEESFLHEIEFYQDQSPEGDDNLVKLKKNNIIEYGKLLKQQHAKFRGSDFEVGCSNIAIDDTKLREILSKQPAKFKDKYIIAIPTDEDLSNLSWDGQGHGVRKLFSQHCHMFFASNQNTIDFGLGKKHNSREEYLSEFKSFKPCAIGSDAHSCTDIENKLGQHYIKYKVDDPSKIDYESKVTWIKANTIFSGLKQVLYEPFDRIRIQSESPDFDFEKSPFTEIDICESVQVFNDDLDNVTFAKAAISLNNNLISIIGGRGSGKSVLVNYLANGLGKNVTNKPYTKDANFAINRKVSLKDSEQTYAFGEEHNIQFMYISQSEIKDIVGDPINFTRNIRETIGVTEEYNISAEYIEDSEYIINEYFRIVKILNANNTSYDNKLLAIDKDIKKFEDFIKNITSEENKAKLEKYTHNIHRLNDILAWKDRINKLQNKITSYCNDINNEISDIHTSWSKLNIPKIDHSETSKYLSDTVLKQIDGVKLTVETEIQKTKNEFSSYTGDLTALLSNVTTYQNKVSKLKEEKESLKKEDAKYELLKTSKFSLLGLQIETSINKYADVITSQWLKFKEGHPEMTKDMKSLLVKILENDNLDVVVDIKFDANKFYALLADKLDGRTYNERNLRETLRIFTLDDFYLFVKQDVNAVNLFDETAIRIDLRNKLLDLLYVKYTSYITHKIVVRSGGKPITKLSHGQQGTIYLRMKLAANLFTETIIYDQPEDDLDNKFIMTELVDLFRKIKKYRQVIIVSHNANLVVNADSEQIIIAENNDGVLNYTTGALEDPSINAKICDILEGGSRAFLEREKKYNLS